MLFCCVGTGLPGTKGRFQLVGKYAQKHKCNIVHIGQVYKISSERKKC